MTARLIAVVGPSGAGKDTLMAAALAARPDLRAVRRVITRPTAAGGEDFEGVTEAEFDRRKADGAFVLDWQAHGLRYGIPKDALQGGGTVMFNASRGALTQAQDCLPGLSVILVTAPAPILADRLARRGREAGDDQAARLARAGFALPNGVMARVVMNDSTPEDGLTRFLAALQPERA